jgi:hypothetical protein
MGRNARLKEAKRSAKGTPAAVKNRNLAQRQNKVAMIEEQLRSSSSRFYIPSEHQERLKEYIANGTDYIAEYPQEHVGKILIVELYNDKSKPCQYIIRTPAGAESTTDTTSPDACTDGCCGHSHTEDVSEEIVCDK